jgi:hypothetical protein
VFGAGRVFHGVLCTGSCGAALRGVCELSFCTGDFLAGFLFNALHGAVDEFFGRLAKVLKVGMADSWSGSFDDLGLLAWFRVVVDALVDVVGF